MLDNSLKCHPSPRPIPPRRPRREPWGNGARRRMTFQTSWIISGPWLFLSRRQKNMDKIVQKSPPPPPSLSISKQCRILILVLVLYAIRGGGGGGGRGGGLSRTCLKPCFPACGKKKHRHFFTERISVANFSSFWATWKIAMNLSLGASFHGPFQLCYSIWWWLRFCH